MSETERVTYGESSIETIHREFDGEYYGWNHEAWLIELEEEIQVNVNSIVTMTDYFVASKKSIERENATIPQTIVFPVNDLFTPLKHYGVVGRTGWGMSKAITAFRGYLNQRPDRRAMQEIQPLTEDES